MSVIDQQLLTQVFEFLSNQPPLYDQLNTSELEKGIDLVDIYSVYGDIEGVDYEEPGEIPFNFEMEQEFQEEQVQEAPPPPPPSEITLEAIRAYDRCDPFYKAIAEAQGELEVFLDRNQDIYRSLKIYSDQLKYGELYECDAKYVEKIKFTLILLSEWLIAICHKSQAKKRILIQTQTKPRIQYRCNIFLDFLQETKKQYESGKKITETKRHNIHEVLLAATPDMAYILSEAFVISKLTNSLINQIGESCSIRQWLILVRNHINLNNTEFQELLKKCREYFTKHSTF